MWRFATGLSGLLMDRALHATAAPVLAGKESAKSALDRIADAVSGILQQARAQ